MSGKINRRSHRPLALVLSAVLPFAAAVAFAATAAHPAEVAHNDWGNAFIDTRLCAEAVGVADIDTLTPTGAIFIIH